MATIKYKNREEMVAAVKKAVEKKRQWEKQAREQYAENQMSLGRPVLQ